nr:integrator complex subunit 11 [Tanacetum cinerariifolium]
MKLWERVTERRLRRETSVFKNQFGFMPRQSSIEATHLIRSLMEKYRERQRDMHLAFIDMEKAYDSVPRDLIWKTLINKGASKRYIKATSGSAISPYIFALILDELSRGIQDDIPWCMIFTDDTVLVSESAEGLNDKLENWRENISDATSVTVRSPITKKWNMMAEVEGRNKSHLYRIVPLKLKGKFYRAAIRHGMLYGSKCWPNTKALANMMDVTELRMLRWTCGKTMLDMFPNGVYREELEVETIINKMRERRLRWFWHVRRRPQSTPVRRVEALVVDDMRRMGRPKLRWEDKVKLDMNELLLSEDITSDRNEWRARISLGS